ncbi:hypothetical protein [Ponticaulis sp.]|uniref:Flp family type IVb pilin n=1 Tax=Ponticaulis sp. TaxID=2020902 RepID=UPI000B6F5544|nr:hypothetical protein [Ponticaulis sp.]MAI90150.1 Flp family type IVb pilin [Ponticaulis sp.]OUX99802.1 MAG: hypothetical protein CBB65_06895 [Hyphomonadaceae bacterium TMED5]|tara:strand:- start:108432 stop:108614 length:183 start_codon:yes stop_codon:yes gene_type:complete
MRFLTTAKRFLTDRSGGHVVEYALIAGLIVIGIISALNAISASTTAMYNNLDEQWDEASS